jgi:hypothetical protein
VHERLDLRAVFLAERARRVDEMQELAAHADDVGVDPAERFEQAGLTEIGKRGRAGETREVSHGLD